ncbi:DUF6929 family protein [Aquabacterium humicola]|uniref:DUF6929 family protein n=1 Tax=Aquabacterium humicola TaxID=3237377 RepID=UPI002543837B|nr:hypothetical protein [Rubrivivax pictus]
MLSVELVRHLTVADAAGAAMPLSAASGLVALRGHLAVVADDEHTLGLFRIGDAGPGRLLPLFAGGLPAEHHARKAAKPDLEALTVLPPFAGHPHGALFAAGSGSTPNRRRGALLALDGHGLPAGPVRIVDLSPLHEALRTTLGELNLEGLLVADDDVCLLQRAHRGLPVGACVRYRLAGVLRWLAGEAAAPAPRTIEHHDLGAIGGVPLGFTDGAALPGGGWLFCAAAEDTADSYLDGANAGSVVGHVDAHGRVRAVHALASTAKVEGITIDPDPVADTVWLVTDADDRQVPAALLRLRLSAVLAPAA